MSGDTKINMQKDMQKVLDLVAHFQIEAQKIKRYEGNPFVEGDNVAEHLARVARLLTCIVPNLKKEFPDNPELVEEIYSCLLVHDDDEVIVGFDVPTAKKVHNNDNAKEISQFTEAVSGLAEETVDFLIKAFSSFRNRDTLASKIAKALDNITGNQLVVEQEIGLVSPDSARFCIEYSEKVRGISETTDALVDAQIEQVIEFRKNLAGNKTKIEEMSKFLGLSDTKKIEELLAIDITSHILDISKVFTPIEEL